MNCQTELVVSTEGKTDCKRWNSDEWGGKKRVLPPEILHYVAKDKTQRLERTLGTVRQQTGRWHRRQNMRDCGRNPSPRNSRKFGNLWELSESDSAISSELLQLVWAAQPIQNNGGSKSRTNQPALELARYCYLSNNPLTHYPVEY